MRKTENENDENNLVAKQDFLKSAIGDLAGNIRFLDTKISLLMTVMGVILGVLISCRKNIYFSYKATENIYWMHILFCVLFIAIAVFSVLSFFFGLLTIIARGIKPDFNSIWFLGDRIKDFNFNSYKNEILKLTNKSIIDNLSCELYKLNQINTKKMKFTKISIHFFAYLCIAICLITVIVIICYL